MSHLVSAPPSPLPDWKQDRFRRELVGLQNEPAARRGKFVAMVLEDLCGFSSTLGQWHCGSKVDTSWTRHGMAREVLRPSQLWLAENGTLPVFLDDSKRLGIGHGRRSVTRALQWLRAGNEQLALITNGFQWRILFAGLDYDAWCEWDVEQWLAGGEVSPEFEGFRGLLQPAFWSASQAGQPCPLLAAVNDSRKGQSELSKTLGERVRQAAELLIDGHAAALNPLHDQLDPQDIYRAAVRVIMRMVVTLFAESREGLLPRDSPVFHTAYSLQGLREQLDRTGPSRRVASYAAWPRIIALFRLVYHGSAHEALPVPGYGGELFEAGSPTAVSGMNRALYQFENAWAFGDLMNDAQVRQILELLTRTRIRIRQGRSTTETSIPVDFSTLDSEYIGILYEGLLDFELRCAVDGQPIVFLAVGNQPALPLTTLESMNDKAIKDLFTKLKDTSTKGDAEDGAEEEEDTEEAEEDIPEEFTSEEEDIEDDVEAEIEEELPPVQDDPRFLLRDRAEQWARSATLAAGLIKKPKGKITPEKQLAWERELASKARQLITKVVMPGEWYLVRWGGTRKGSGTFYTRPQLAIPTVHRTLRPLAYTPPVTEDGQPNQDAPHDQWTPKRPEEILAIKVCDPACGSGSFPLAALRYLTNALYESIFVHGRVEEQHDRSVLRLILNEGGTESLGEELFACRPDDDQFEVRTRAILRRYVVERCIYGVDLDPLAVELCRLALWIETLDRRLPLTFLNHKIKCGNALVGAWFDQFLHYPIMAWYREGGDKAHTNGVHFEKEAWTKAIKEKANKARANLKDWIDGSFLKYAVNLESVRTEHDVAAQALQEIHGYGITQARDRAERYEALVNDPEFVRLKETFDLWCALWFWPPDALDWAPLPVEFASGKLDEQTRDLARTVAAERRFFHWELEFPDVFHVSGSGFDAVLGNPPWDIAKPVSKEFFSALDPLYRTYGKQEAIPKQKTFFETDRDIEARWLGYNAFFRALSNWMKYAGCPFGDKETEDTSGSIKHDCNLGDRGKGSVEVSAERHARWRQKREETSGYADAEHAFRHQGSGDINLYKMFLEQAHALLRTGGRMGFVVPSGLYSDFGTRALRSLFLDECQWEWIFGFENREGIFEIHRSFKFNPVIIQKGGTTASIRTAFMRRNLADWEQGEKFATDYPRERVVQFSPNSLAILEIQSERDLEILTKIYANSVLLGDQGPDGWGITYSREFDMTNDSKLFPPRTKWEEWGYQPDEYSRWIKGPWKPIADLWKELAVNPEKPIPVDAECNARIKEGIANGEVARTGNRLRCAQPPYDTLPIPRADIPEGIILNREATQWLREDEIPVVTFTEANGKPLKVKRENEQGKKVEIRAMGPAVALPLYQGRVLNVYRFSNSHWTSGSGASTVWKDVDAIESELGPQFLLPYDAAMNRIGSSRARYAFRDIARSTDTKTIIGSCIPAFPSGHTVPLLRTLRESASLAGALQSIPFEWAIRFRHAGTHLVFATLTESGVYPPDAVGARYVKTYAASLCFISQVFSSDWLFERLKSTSAWKYGWAISNERREILHAAIDALVAIALQLNARDLKDILRDCDHPSDEISRKAKHSLSPTGFWRINKEKHPEHRHTVLTLIAFHDLQEKIAACGGDVEKGIEAFCAQNDGEGWMLPETLRLSDYGLGHDDRAKEHQPVRSCFGPRFYDWQLAQTLEESWRECRIHARNLLGPNGYQELLDELAGKKKVESDWRGTRAEIIERELKHTGARQSTLDFVDDLPLFAYRERDGEGT